MTNVSTAIQDPSYGMGICHISYAIMDWCQEAWKPIQQQKDKLLHSQAAESLKPFLCFITDSEVGEFKPSDVFLNV